MSTMPVQEIKRRGISAADAALAHGPVHLLKNNRAAYVVMTEEDYQGMMGDLTEARLAASEADLRAGRTTQGSASDLMGVLAADDSLT
jgi:PHD/YefM family antitoxin component YafN of YafNO toxin-antitoxin module